MTRRTPLANWPALLLACCSIVGTQFSPHGNLIAQPESEQTSERENGVIPAVVGLSASEAKAAVTEAGFVAQFQLGPKAPSKGQVLTVADQTPTQGAKLAKGEPVILTVFAGDATSTSDADEAATGGRAAVVPYLIGGSAADARTALRAHGLVPEFRLGLAAPTEELSLTVFAQTPWTGTKLARGSSVAVMIYAQYKPQSRLAPSTAAGPELTGVLATPFVDGGNEQIDPRTGQLTMIATDLSVAAGPIDLQITRFLQTIRKEPGLLGTRWRLNWEKRVLRNEQIAVVQEGAGMTPFELDSATGLYRSLDGEQLQFLAGRAIRTLRDGTKEFFGSDGRLVRCEKRNGNQITLQYDRQGRLSRIDGPFQTFLEFQTDQTGLLTRAQASNGASVRYSYGSQAPPADDGSGVLPLSYAYAADGTLIRVERPQSGATEFGYDQQGRVTSRRWADSSREQYEYDDDNNTLTHTDPAGNVTNMKWSADRLHAEVTDALGHTTVINYDEEARPRRIDGPTGEALITTYDGFGRIASVDNSTKGRTRIEYDSQTSLPSAIVRPDGQRESFEYDAAQNIARIVRSNTEGPVLQTDFAYYPSGLVKTIKTSLGFEFSYDYDNNGHVSSITDAAGNTAHFEHDRRGRLLRRIDPLGGVTSYAYDDHGRLTRSIDPTGATTRLEYSPRGLLARWIDPLGSVTEYEHDERGQLVSKTDPAGRKTRYAYHPTGRLKSIIDAAGHTVAFEHDGAGYLVRTTNPLGGVTTRAFDPLGRLLEQTDPAGAKSRFEYSKAGKLSKMIDQTGQALEFAYDASGRVTSATTSAGRTARLAYSARGEVAEVALPTGSTATYEYDSAGNILRVIEAGREVVRYAYDVLGRRTKATWSTGREVEYRYNALGDLVGWSDNLGAGSTVQYDGNSRVTAIQDSSGGTTRFRYDPAGNLTAVTDPLGRQKRMRYNAAGELTEVVEPSGARATFAYDDVGNLATVRHPDGGETKYAYNGLGSVTEVTDPLGNTANSTYDPAGRLLSTTDAKGQTTRFEYDTAGRVVKKSLADGKVVTYKYDERSNLIAVDDGAFPVRYAYDADDRLTRIEYPAIKKTLAYEYDERGRLIQFVDPVGRSSTYEYDPADRLEAIRLDDGRSVAFTYDSRGRRTSVRYPNGVKGVWEYDAADRPVNLTYTDASGKSVAAWTYRYDEAGNCIKTVAGGGRSTEYRYDPDGQLIEERTPRTTRSYAYLPGGNRASLETKAGTVDYRYDQADRLLQAGDETFQYDANGNLIERSGANGATRYSYDAEDRLVKVNLPDGGEVTYGYAPTGERIWRKDADGLTHYVTDGLHVLAELDEDLNTDASYVYGPGIDDALLMLRSEDAFCFHLDRIGSVSRITDPAGKIAGSYEYDAFGRMTSASGELQNDLGFTARRFDLTTGLYYYRARYYDPAVGRFLSRDTLPGSVSDLRSLNQYTYALNVPTRFTDPLGLAPKVNLRTPPNPFGAESRARWGITGREAKTLRWRARQPEFRSHIRRPVGGPSRWTSATSTPRIEGYSSAIRGSADLKARTLLDHGSQLGLRGKPLLNHAHGTLNRALARAGGVPPAGTGPRPLSRLVEAEAALARAAPAEAAAARTATGSPVGGTGSRVVSVGGRILGAAGVVGLATHTVAGLIERRDKIGEQFTEGLHGRPSFIGSVFTPFGGPAIGNVIGNQAWEVGGELLTGVVHLVTKELPEQFGTGWERGGGLRNPVAATMGGIGEIGVQQVIVAPIKGAVTGIGRLGSAVADWVKGKPPPGSGPLEPPGGADDAGPGEDLAGVDDDFDDDAEDRAKAEEMARDWRNNQRIRGRATQIVNNINAARRAAAQQAAVAAGQREAARTRQTVRTIQSIFDAFGRGNRGSRGGRGGQPHGHDRWGRDIPR